MVAPQRSLCYDLDMVNEAEIIPNIAGPHVVPNLEQEVADSGVAVVHEDEDHRKIGEILGQFGEPAKEAQPPITDGSGTVKIQEPQKPPDLKKDSVGFGNFHFGILRKKKEGRRELKDAA